MQTPDPARNDAKMRPETEKRLTLLLYHPRHSGDPDGLMRFARELLGRPDLRHANVMDLCDADACRLADAIEKAYPDRTARIVARTVEHFKSRLQ